MPEFDTSEKQWQEMKHRDPWRGRGAVSVGTVMEVGRGRISARSFGTCVRIALQDSKPSPEVSPQSHVFWLPETARKGVPVLPRPGARVAFLHHLRLGVRALQDLKTLPASAPLPTDKEYDRMFDVYWLKPGVKRED